MKTIKYNFRSDSKRNVLLPEEYAKKAGRLVDIALDSKDIVEFAGKVSLYPSLTGVYIPEKTLGLIVNKEGILKLQDEVYFTTCLHLGYDDLSKNKVIDNEFPAQESGNERAEKIRTVENIKKILKSIERGDNKK